MNAGVDLADLLPGRLDGAGLPAAKVAEMFAGQIEAPVGLAKDRIGVLTAGLAPFGPTAQIGRLKIMILVSSRLFT